MSHVATIEIQITNLEDLKAAAAELGLEWCEGQQTYHWYGEHVGDFPLPDGFNIEDLGRCEHALKLNPSQRLAAMNKYNTSTAYVIEPYEIGIVRRRDGRPGWTMLWDFYCGGRGLQDVIGENAGRLKQAIATAASIRTMTAQGYRPVRKSLPNGTVQLTFTR